MNKEAQEKLAYQLLASHWLCEGIIADTWKSQSETMKEYWLQRASNFTEDAEILSYHKLSGEPPICDENSVISWGSGSIKYEFRVGNEVRRKLLLTDVAGFEREFTIIINDKEGIKTVK